MKKIVWGAVGLVALILVILAIRMNWRPGSSPSSAEELAAKNQAPEPVTEGATPFESPLGEATPNPVVELSAGIDQRLSELKQGLPEDAAALVERLVGCMHMSMASSESGDEGDDEEHRAEIEAQSEKLGCATVLDEREKLLQKYKGNEKVERAFDEAEAFSD